jgi:hypothetical protein
MIKQRNTQNHQSSIGINVEECAETHGAGSHCHVVTSKMVLSAHTSNILNANDVIRKTYWVSE